MGIRF